LARRAGHAGRPRLAPFALPPGSSAGRRLPSHPRNARRGTREPPRAEPIAAATDHVCVARLGPMRAAAVRTCWPATIVVLFTAGCGTASSSPQTREQTIVLHWHETAGQPGNRLIVDVDRLVVRRDGWAVSAAFKNDSPATLVVSRRHKRHGTEFGILLFRTRSRRAAQNPGPGFFASRFTPAPPMTLRPGARWSGTFSGEGRLPAGDYVRIELGSFGPSGAIRPPLSMQFEYITDHVVRLPAN
jgi:hypothetical protein